MKKLTAMLLALALVLGLAACGGNGTTDIGGNNASLQEQTQANLDQKDQLAAENGITSMEGLPFDSSRKSTANTDERYPYLSFAQSLSIKEWQPFNLRDTAKFYQRQLIYEFLFDRVGADEYVPRIGKSWTQEDDTHYLVEIYDYVKDTKGNAITASDVVFSYELTKNSGYAYKLDNYKSATAVDDSHVRFELEHKIDTLDGFNFLFAYVAIVNEDSYDEAAFSREPIGTGPYVMSKFVTDSYCEFEANDNYWQKEELRSPYAAQKVQTIHIDFVTDASMRMILLENGSSICNPYLAESDLNSFLAGGEFAGQFNLTTTSNPRSTTLLANMSDNSIMKDINMRLACWYAINSAGLVTALGTNSYTACIVDAASCIGDYQKSWNEIESYQTEYNTELAKEYLQKAGYQGQTIKILAGTFDLKKNTAQIVAEMLRQVGIDTSIEIVEYVNQSSRIHDYAGWDIYVDYAEDDDYCINRLYNIYSLDTLYSEDGHTTSYIVDDHLQEMITECTSPEGYSVELTEEILRYIIEQAYGYAGCFTNSFVAWNKDVAKIAVAYGWYSTPLFNACDYYLD